MLSASLPRACAALPCRLATLFLSSARFCTRFVACIRWTSPASLRPCSVFVCCIFSTNRAGDCISMQTSQALVAFHDRYHNGEGFSQRLFFRFLSNLMAEMLSPGSGFATVQPQILSLFQYVSLPLCACLDIRGFVMLLFFFSLGDG